MKRAELVFSAILVPVDYLMLVAAALAAYRLRFVEIASLRPVVYELPFREYFSIIIIVGLLWLAVFALSGLYTIQSTRRFLDEFIKITLACSTGVLLIIVLIFFQRELFSSRFIILAAWVLAVLFVTCGRLVVRSVQRSLFQRGFGVRQVMLIGSGNTAEILQKHFSASAKSGFRIAKYIPQIEVSIGEQVRSIIEQEKIDEIILADPGASRQDRQSILDVCNEFHTGFKYAADVLDAKVSNIWIETVAGQPVIEIKRTPLDGWGRILKRVGDTILAALALVILSPVFLIVALIIVIDSPGPIFFRSERVGEGNRTFGLYKFRSMVPNAHAMKRELLRYNERQDGPLFKMKDDPRITRFGRFIRRSSIDEIPQFYNVLKGEMSLVGPRPHEPEEVGRYQKKEKMLLVIKPGITGLAQISGRSDLNFHQEVRLDTYYIENWSPILDLKILLRTPWVVVSMRSVS
ncbi:MAG: sugar transferase [bacterium]|nr:sugar transferase [bacterium]